MIKNEQASLSIKKIAFITILFMFILGVSTMATNVKLNNVKIILSNNYELNILTTKTKVGEILEENHIMVLPEEIVIPNLEAEITNNKTITITKAVEESTIIKLAEENNGVSLEQLLGNYTPIVEKIITEQVEIPYETITKENDTNKVITEGKNGLKQITYKVKYRNNVEVERTLLYEEVLVEPINKVTGVNNKVTASRASTTRISNPAAKSSNELAKQVKGKSPKIKTFNASAYCSCAKCCGKTNGITASGSKATSWHTLAAGSAYPIGTIIYIPALKDKPNGGWFVVQDRGGAISSSKLDIYMSTHGEALQFGRKNLECYVYM